jgi:hypothetical protein
VIVTTNSGDNGQVIIYDGDDPDMPMWMKFNVGYNSPNRKMIGVNSAENLTSSSMLNAKLVTGTRDGASDDGGVYIIDFIKDNRLLYQVGGYFGPHILNEIANRNVSTTSRGTQFGPVILIVNPNVNDVAMTVLPNAPIDDATGLPIPTIAVATPGGVSVIKDDGTVVDLTCSQGNYNQVFTVAFNENNDLIYDGFNNNAAAGSDGKAIRINEIPSSDTVVATLASAIGNSKRIFHYGDWYTQNSGLSIGEVVTSGGKFIAPTNDATDINFGESIGVSKVKLGETDSRFDGSVCLIKSSYNTGWMHGDIKGAFLSDTDATNVTGTGWFTTTPSSAGTNVQISGNQLQTTAAVSSAIVGNFRTNPVNLDTTLQYVVTSTATVNSGSVRIYIGDNLVHTHTSSGTLTSIAKYTTGGAYLTAWGYSSFTGSIELDAVRYVDKDRSVNNNGLGIYGTITKSAVATGAELVAYSGFGTSNYLQRPAENLNIGTGDFSFLCWGKGIRNYEMFLAYGSSVTNSGNLIIQTGGDTNGSDFRVFINGVGYASNLGPLSYTTGWNLYSIIRRNGILHYYHNTTLIESESATGSIGNSAHTLRIGDGGNVAAGQGIGSDAMDVGSISLLRLSASAISEDQLSKIYEDEKVLFQENAACTLYGSSDAVTALAYDDSTNLLYAGTSSGRSDFQGLRRINNTTTAVTTAISASNGLVAEQ